MNTAQALHNYKLKKISEEMNRRATERQAQHSLSSQLSAQQSAYGTSISAAISQCSAIMATQAAYVYANQATVTSVMGQTPNKLPTSIEILTATDPGFHPIIMQKLNRKAPLQIIQVENYDQDELEEMMAFCIEQDYPPVTVTMDKNRVVLPCIIEADGQTSFFVFDEERQFNLSLLFYMRFA